MGGAGAAGGGAAVGGEGRPGVLKKAGWEQGAAKVSRVQPVQAEDGEAKATAASLTDLGVRNITAPLAVASESSFGRVPSDSGLRSGPYRTGNVSALSVEPQDIDSESGKEDNGPSLMCDQDVSDVRPVKLFPPASDQHPGMARGSGQNQGETEPSMKDLLLAINGLTTNVGGVKTSLAEFRSEMTGFRTEMSGVKADVVRIETHMKTHMVTKENLAEEVRAQIKAQNTSSFNTSEVKSLRKQISKMDPAQKSVRFQRFKEENLAKRVACIEQILKEVRIGRGQKPEFVYEHVSATA